jgi:Uma2 family endonuclease
MVVPGVYRDQDWIELPRPLLVIEVLSPSTRRRDFGIKLSAYHVQLGVPEVWPVDREERAIHICRFGEPTVLERHSFRWFAPNAPEPLVVDVEALLGAG